MVDDVDWSSIFKQGMIRKQWSKTRLGNLNEKPCLLQLKIELLIHCSRGDIYSSLCFLYLLIIFSTFSIVTPTLDHIISSGKLVGTEWKISVLTCHSQVNRLEVRCSVQFSSVAQSCPTLCDPMNHSTPGLPVHHQLLESTHHVHWVGDAIQSSPLSPPSPLTLNLSQHQGLFKRVSSSHQVAKVLEFQFQNQSYQWTPRIDL